MIHHRGERANWRYLLADRSQIYQGMFDMSLPVEVHLRSAGAALCEELNVPMVTEMFREIPLHLSFAGHRHVHRSGK